MTQSANNRLGRYRYLLEKKDSSLVTFTMTGNDGHFELKGFANGEYRILITHVNYFNSNKIFTISDNNKNADLEI
ncbi:MAG: hypothetical protein IPQ06_14115 [Chitinophagaceae bacterium]|nr:hypothetical protein [Chitinophagaceae bacterium]